MPAEAACVVPAKAGTQTTYWTSVNLLWLAPQIGHLSGAEPTTVFPQTSHT
jgi:hypothetical protein